MPIAQAAERLDMKRRGGRWGPCPSCGEEHSASDRRRGLVHIDEARGLWHCKGGDCGAGGSVLDLVCAAHRLGRFRALDSGGKDRVLRWIEAEGYGLAPALQAPRPDRSRRSLSREVLDRLWWNARQVTASRQSCAWLRSRALEPTLMAQLDLVRECQDFPDFPRWAHCRGRTWGQERRLLLRLFNARGLHCSFRARALAQDAPANLKEIAPAAGPGSASGMVMANGTGQRMLREGRAFDGWQDRARWVVIVEGGPDFLTWSQQAHVAEGREHFPVLGLFAGAWRQELAERVPDGATVLLRTHHDPAGDRYARQVAESLGHRCDLRRSLPAEGEL